MARYYSDKKAREEPPAMFIPGEIVIDRTDRDSNGKPTGKKLWVWKKQWNPSYENSPLESERKMAMSYFVKDGSGEDAQDMGWRSEEDLVEWYPAEEEEPLIEL